MKRCMRKTCCTNFVTSQKLTTRSLSTTWPYLQRQGSYKSLNNEQYERRDQPLPGESEDSLIRKISSAKSQNAPLGDDNYNDPNHSNPRQPHIRLYNTPRKGLPPNTRRPSQRARDDLNRKLEQRRPTELNATRNRETNQAAEENISVDGVTHKFSTVLLRDLCECSSCVDGSTKQKLFSTADIPPSIRAKTITEIPNAVGIQWDQDVPGYPSTHTTELSTETLRNLANIGFSTAPFSPGRQTLWDAEMFSKLSDLDYEAYMQDDSTLYKALQQLHYHGLMFLSNVPGSEKSVSTIAERIGPVKNTFYGYTWDVRSVPEAKNVAYTSQDLGFHMDLLYMQQPPHLQFLHCIRSSAAGGASLFTDSYRAAQELFEADIDTFDNLARFKAVFHYNHPSSHLYRQARSVFELQPLLSNNVRHSRAKDLVRKHAESQFSPFEKKPPRGPLRIVDWFDAVSWSPPFQGPFSLLKEWEHSDEVPSQALDNLSRRTDELHAGAQAFSKLIHRPEGIYERLMKPGECVIFDNRRVLHARKAFEVGDAGTERWLRGAYLDKDPYWSKLQVLSRRFRGVEIREDVLRQNGAGNLEAASNV